MKAHRVIAYLLDAIILGVISSILCFLAGIELEIVSLSHAGAHIIYNPLVLMNLGVGIVYFLTDVLYGGSPGKKMLGLQVNMISAGNDRFRSALVRSLIKVLSIHVLIGVIFFFLMDSSLHDKAANTRVGRKVAIA